MPLKDLKIEDLPQEWNWENVNGVDFTGQHIDQGHCGSCYLLATNMMLESRIKIWFGEFIPLSVQHRLDCSFINEGCHGGWGYFDGLFMENYGAVSSECAEYVASSSPEGCGKWASCPIVAGVEDTYYVGTRTYGQMSEADMIKEVRARGPILVDFNAGAEFQAYRGGILSEDRPVSETFTNSLSQIYTDSYCETYGTGEACMTGASTATQESQGLQWTKLTHSTVIIGYGEQDGQKYWLVRNSYGKKWGENGNLRLRRGRNDYACESENIAVIPRKGAGKSL